MLQLVLTGVLYLILVIPVGRYLYHIAAGKHTFADPVLDRIDDVIYKIVGVDPHRGMNWRQYALALIGTNAVMIAIGYLILRIQSIGIFNPNHIGSMEPSLAFNTIISFMTNTNLQHYSGESGLSYLSQMLVITFMMFVSAASGYRNVPRCEPGCHAGGDPDRPDDRLRLWTRPSYFSCFRTDPDPSHRKSFWPE